MVKTRIILGMAVCIAMISNTAFATRYIETKKNISEEASGSAEANTDDDRFIYDSNKDYGNIYYTDDIPGTRKNLYEGYEFNGKQITVTDLSKLSTFKAEDILNFSDAIVDYNNWDCVLGGAEYDIESNIIKLNCTSSTNTIEKCFGYGGRKFGCEPLEFELMITADKDNYDGFLGISYLMSKTQSPNWESNDGYMVCVKNDAVEFQRYISGVGQQIVLTKETKAFSPNVWHKILIDTVKNEEENIITLKVDDEEIFTFTDDEGEKQSNEGYINFLCYAGNSISIKATNANINHMASAEEKRIDGIAMKIGEPKTFVNGSINYIDESNYEIKPFISNNRTMIPLRFLAEALGAYVSYDDELKTARLSFDNCNIEITQGFYEYKVDNDYYVSDVKPQTVNGRIFVPVRVISEAVQKSVEYEDKWIFVSDNSLSEEEKAWIRSHLE